MSDIVFDGMIFDRLKEIGDQHERIAALEAEVARLRLTEKERKAIKNACKLGTFRDEIATIQGFLDRTS